MKRTLDYGRVDAIEIEGRREGTKRERMSERERMSDCVAFKMETRLINESVRLIDIFGFDRRKRKRRSERLLNSIHQMNIDEHGPVERLVAKQVFRCCRSIDRSDYMIV